MLRRGRAGLLAIIACWAVPAGAGEVRGRILVGDRPAAGVTLSAVPFESPEDEARREARGTGAPPALATATTRGDGAFVLAVGAASPAALRVRAEGGGVVPAWLGGAFDAMETEDLGEHTLVRAEALAGRVVSATGAPVAGATVVVLAPVEAGAGDGDLAPVRRVLTTAADGVFRSTEAASTGNRLLVLAKGFGAASLGGVRAGALPRPVTLGLAALVRGEVRTREGQPPARPALVRYEGEGLETPWVETSAEGRFELPDLPVRAGRVVAEGGEAGLGQAPTGALPRSSPLTVVLAAAPGVAGRVVDARSRAPVPRARVTLEDGARTLAARAGPDGRYHVRGLLAQRAYRLRVDEPRYAPYVRERLVVATGETLRLDAPLRLAATLTGRVVDEGGRPVSGATGRLSVPRQGGPAARWGARREGGRFAFRTAGDGTFQVRRLPPGEEQRLTVVHPDYAAATTGGLSLAPGASSTVTVVLRRGLTLAGRVRDETGRPVPEAVIEVAAGRGFGIRAARALAGVALTGAGTARALTGSDGRFEVKGLGEADYSVTVSKEGFAEHRLDRVPVDPDRDPIEVTLVAGAAIRGVVIRRDGRGAEGYWVRAVEPGTPGAALGPLAVRDLRPTGADGSFEIASLRAGGVYDLVLLGPEGSTARREGVPAPSDGVEVVVPAPARIAGRVVDAQTLSAIADFEVDFGPDRSSGLGGRGAGVAGRLVARMARAAGDGGAGAGPQPVHSEDGAYVIEGVPPGTWEVVARAKGYQPARVGSLTVEEGSAREGVEIRLVRGRALRGRVLDAATGAPVLDAAVTVQRGGAGGRALAVLQGESDARTDTEGAFSVEGLAAGSYLAVAQHPEYARASALVEVKEGAAAVDLRLQPGSTLGGTVVSETSAPLAGAAVTLSAGTAGRGGFPAAGADATVTDDAGRFRFTHVTPGRYVVSARLRGQQTPRVEVTVAAGQSPDNLVLSLASGTRLRGMVTGLPTPLAGPVTVSAFGPDGYFASASAAADGGFELTGAPPGPIDLRATAGDGAGRMRAASAQVTVAEGQAEAQVEVAFRDGFSLAGTVTRAGQPVEGAVVSAAPEGGRPAASARTDASGAFRLDGLSQGPHTVTLVPPAGSGPRRETITIGGDARLDLVIPSARLGGAVVEAGTRQPLADAAVQAAPRGKGAAGRGASTDSNGRFGLDDLEPDTYTVTARKAGYQPRTVEATPAEGGTEDLVLELERGAGVGLEVRDAALGVPLRAVQVRALGGDAAFAGTVVLDGEGRGEIASLPPGAHTLAVYAAGYAPTVVSVVAPSARVPVAVTAGGDVEIRAGAATIARGPARAQVVTPSGAPYPFAFFAADGRLTLSAPVRRLENLAPGSYVLQVAGSEPQPFQVQPGALAVVNLP